MTDWIDTARALPLDLQFMYAVLGVSVISVALLHCAEAWGRARARRRTASAIAQTERASPPEAQTWEHTHSSEQIKLRKESR
jgi:TRAP-type C4-dicarboxylate transport system permease small subunit